MTHKDRVGRIVVELAPGLVGDSDILECTATLELKLPLGSERDEPPLTLGVTGTPRA
jgi:hypothetical protein